MNASSQTRLPGHDEAEQLIGEFTLHEFRLLSKLSLHISVDHDGPVQKIDLVLTTNKRVPPARMHLRFSHVSGFKTAEWPGGVINIAGLDVVNMSQNQMDGINWQVFDYEAHSFMDSLGIDGMVIVQHQCEIIFIGAD